MFFFLPAEAGFFLCAFFSHEEPVNHSPSGIDDSPKHSEDKTSRRVISAVVLLRMDPVNPTTLTGSRGVFPDRLWLSRYL